MLDPDKELELLEEEFPRSRRAWTHETSAELDARILDLAARKARYLRATGKPEAQSRDFDPSPGSERRPGRGKPDNRSIADFRRERPSVAASPESDDNFGPSQDFRGSAYELPVPAGAERLLASLQDAQERAWRYHISGLVSRGDVDTALYLLNQYRKKFPKG